MVEREMSKEKLFSPSDEGRIDVPLSHKNQRLLELVAYGLNNDQIAQEIGYSFHTVKLHLSGGKDSLFEKLEVNTKMQAVLAGINRGYITPLTATASYDISKVLELRPVQLKILEHISTSPNSTDEELAQSLGPCKISIRRDISTICQELDVPGRIPAVLMYLAATENLTLAEAKLADRTNESDNLPYQERFEDRRYITLSPQDVQILDLLAKGKSPVTIAKIMDIPYRQVKEMLYGEEGIYEQLKVSTYRAAVHEATRLEIISPEDPKPRVQRVKYVRENSHDITRRENNILTLIGQGKNNEEIKEALGLREQTIKNNCTIIFEKLHVTDRLGALLKGVSTGIIDLSQFSPPTDLEVIHQLSPRLLQILAEITQDPEHTKEADVCTRLGISPVTIKNAFQNIYKIIGTRDKLIAALMYLSYVQKRDEIRSDNSEKDGSSPKVLPREEIVYQDM
ncbi:hypothetical protein BH11PAT1_BH11PAT1_5940 [soil metagenome]